MLLTLLYMLVISHEDDEDFMDELGECMIYGVGLEPWVDFILTFLNIGLTLNSRNKPVVDSVSVRSDLCATKQGPILSAQEGMHPALTALELNRAPKELKILHTHLIDAALTMEGFTDNSRWNG